MIKILHISDIHMGDSFSHGKINPETGHNTRLDDFVNSLKQCIDHAVSLPVDLVLFGGDAFPNSTPPPYVQEAFASQFRRLADAKIPTVLLVGNHDQHSQGNGGASLSIYRTLLVPYFQVGDTIKTYRVETENGKIQVITLPWLTRSALLTRKQTEDLSLAEINDLLIKRLQPVLESEIRNLDPSLPTVLLGHLMADRASLGQERFLAVGKGFNIPVSMLIRPEFDYVALGHVHKHQNLNPTNDPPIIYPGSIERVDFGEEKEEKGYVLVEIEKGSANWQFCPVAARPFLTIEMDLTKYDEPQAVLLGAIGKHQIESAIVRVIYQIRPEQVEAINLASLNDALKEAHTYSIRPELISPINRPRLPELGLNSTLDPLAALKTYLDNRDDLQHMAVELVETAELLLASDF